MTISLYIDHGIWVLSSKRINPIKCQVLYPPWWLKLSLAYYMFYLAFEKPQKFNNYKSYSFLSTKYICPGNKYSYHELSFTSDRILATNHLKKNYFTLMTMIFLDSFQLSFFFFIWLSAQPRNQISSKRFTNVTRILSVISDILSIHLANVLFDPRRQCIPRSCVKCFFFMRR